jgi:hypothetical protein
LSFRVHDHKGTTGVLWLPTDYHRLGPGAKLFIVGKSKINPGIIGCWLMLDFQHLFPATLIPAARVISYTMAWALIGLDTSLFADTLDYVS